MQPRFRTDRTGLEDWHFVEDCPKWPEHDFVEQLETPPISQVCEKCVELSALDFAERAAHRRRARSSGSGRHTTPSFKS
ncbi:MAG TPA: hypothetical protein VGH50_20280 [Candidatus Binatia bacterium]